MRVRLIWLLAVVVVAAPVVAATMASGSSKKTYTVKWHGVGNSKTTGNKVVGKMTGKPFGTCTQNGTVVVPQLKFVMHCKKGTVKGAFTITSPLTSNNVKAKWKITGGTGKYKGAKGSGTMKGTVTPGTQNVKGKVKY
jgi:hypothetical protein